MNKIKYIIKRIFNMDYKKLINIINKIHQKTKISKIKILFDIINCTIKYGAGYMDYDLFEMYNLNNEERKTILTRGKNNELIRNLNPKEYWYIIDDKATFNEKFKDYLNREYLKLDNNYEEFKEFINNKKEIIVKPLDATCGIGVEKINLKENKDSKKLYDTLVVNKQILVEEVATQHKDMSKLHPSSINTIRIVTIHNKYNVTSVVCAMCRIGTNNKVVDNFHSGGICAPIDIEKGVINGNAINKNGEIFEVHPTTNIKLLNYEIPNFDKVKQLVMDAHKNITELGIIGWDVCIGSDKPSLIEANQYPAYDLYHTIKTEGKQGVLPLFEQALSKQK